MVFLEVLETQQLWESTPCVCFLFRIVAVGSSMRFQTAILSGIEESSNSASTWPVEALSFSKPLLCLEISWRWEREMTFNRALRSNVAAPSSFRTEVWTVQSDCGSLVKTYSNFYKVSILSPTLSSAVFPFPALNQCPYSVNLAC